MSVLGRNLSTVLFISIELVTALEECLTQIIDFFSLWTILTKQRQITFCQTFHSGYITAQVEKDRTCVQLHKTNDRYGTNMTRLQ